MSKLIALEWFNQFLMAMILTQVITSIIALEAKDKTKKIIATFGCVLGVMADTVLIVGIGLILWEIIN